MEGERILRNILNKHKQNPSLLKDVENYLSPVEECSAKLSKLNLLKYHTFCLKLLRCCIQGFQNCKTLQICLLQICKTAISKLKITFDFLKENEKQEDCQFDRLFKLIYHILMHLHRIEQGKEFFIFSENMLHFSQMQIKSNGNNISLDCEMKNIFTKVFEIQWTLATKSNNKNMKVIAEEALCLRFQAILFILTTNCDILKYGKYLENCLLSCAIDKEKKMSVEIATKINEKLIEAIGILIDQTLFDDDDANHDAVTMTGYLLLLSFKHILTNCDSKKIIEQVNNIILKCRTKGVWIRSLEAICQVYNTKPHCSKASSCKCLKQLLLNLGEIYSYLSEKKILLANPKLTVVFDLVKTCITSQDSQCVEILRHLYKFVDIADQAIQSTQIDLLNEVRRKGKTTLDDKLKTNLNYLESQWHSFLCWCLQVFQSLLSQSKLPKNKSCSCSSSQTKSSGDVFDCCFNLLEKTIRSLSAISNKESNQHQKDFHWLGIMSYNFGILAQNKSLSKFALKFLKATMQMLFPWIENSKSNSTEALSRIQEVNLAMKQKILVEMLTNIGDTDALMICICDFIQLLFTVQTKSNDSHVNELIENQVGLWVKSKARIESKNRNRKDAAEKRLLSKVINGLNKKDLQFLMEAELNAYRFSREVSRSTKEIEELLHLMINIFEEKDPLFAAFAVIEYATLTSVNLDLIERCKLCYKAIKLLKKEAQKGLVKYVDDMLAIAHFFIGFYKLEMQMKTTKDASPNEESTNHIADLKLDQGNEMEESNCTDFASSFKKAIEIWTLHIENVAKLHSDNLVESYFKSPEKSVQCLQFLGFISSLLGHPLNAILALSLSMFIKEHLLKEKDIFDTATYEMIRLLSDLCDFENALKINCSVKILNDIHRVQLDISSAQICNKVGQCLKAESIIKDVLADKNVSNKTPNSFLIKAEALMQFALCQESYREIHDFEGHPILAAQEALRILRSLFKLYFENELEDKQGKHSHASDFHSLSPWIVLNRLLNCLLYLVQRYKMQGSIPEAKCHVKEGILVCKTFMLNQRHMEFLLEEAEIHSISQANEKLKATLETIQSKFRAGLESNEVETPLFCEHTADCTCEFCSNIMQMKLFIQYLMLRKENKDLDVNMSIKVSIDRVLKCAIAKSEQAARNCRNIVGITDIKKARKSVKFIDEAENCVQHCNLDEIVREFKSLSEEDIAYLFYFDQHFKLKLLNRIETSETAKLSEIKHDLEEIKNFNFKRLIFHTNRRTVANIYYENALMLLQSNEGIKEIKSKWNMEKHLISNLKDSRNSGVDDDMERNKVEDEMNGEGNVRSQKTKRNVTSKRGKGRKAKSKKNDEIVQNKEEEEKSSKRKTKKQISETVSVADDVERLCQEALSLLVPCLDCLLIKKLYHLISLVSGYTDIEKTAYLEQLSFATVLKQQTIMRTMKDIRKTSKSDSDDTAITQHKTAVPDVLRISNGPLSFQSHSQLIEMPNSLPQGWRACSLRMSTTGNKRLIISRLQAAKKSMVLSIPLSSEDYDYDEFEDSTMNKLVRDLSSAFQTNPIEELEELLEESLQTLQMEDVESWWKNRKRLDSKIQKLLDKVENKWLGCWKGIILGQRENHDDQIQLETIVNQFCEECQSKFNISLPSDFIELLFDSYPSIDRIQMRKAFQNLLGEKFDESILQLAFEKVEELENDCLKNKEQIPGRGRKSRKTQEKHPDSKIKRLPVILILDKELQKIPWECMSMVHGNIISRMPSIIFTQLGLLYSKDILKDGVNTEDTFYILNPRNDLQNTQKTFEKWFSREKGWIGISGKMPSEEEYRNALKNYSMFVYCGHGNGQEFLRGDEVQRIQCKAVSFLMGCSSGKLQVNGELEARGMALNYLMAGSPAIVANLWDVTDKDIDRFLVQLLKSWLQEHSSTNLLEHLSKARSACKLPFLIGASPIVYGLPMVLNN